jgi:hypothetical protein|tara:strand:+ start:150 stop:845 length:696 start_codon:yes stop_codon:yes gene_type:complete
MFKKPNKIEFIAVSKEMADVWPHPRPASHFIPEEYKKLERLKGENMHAPTLKMCIPFLDAMTAGYIIPFDQDYLVDPTEKEFTVTAANREVKEFGYHGKMQMPEEWHTKSGEFAGKFINKWLIKTQPGYSCLFVQPMNRLGEDRFNIISGVVDTDSYINVVHFPMILLKRDKQFLLKKGDAMIQVIPFRRESWKVWSGFLFEAGHSKTMNLLHSLFIDRYKKMFWKKKDFK